MKHKLKRIFKRTVPLILVCSLTIGAVLGHNTKEVKALTGVEEAALVTAILLAYGYVTTRYFNDTDGANALKNDIEQAYEEARFKVLNGGASGGGGDEDPDDNDFEDTDGDGKITEKDIPQFENISLPGKAAFALSANTAILLKPIVTKFISSQYGLDSYGLPTNVANSLSSACNDLINNSGYSLSGLKYVYKSIGYRTYRDEVYCYMSLFYLSDGYIVNTSKNHVLCFYSPDDKGMRVGSSCEIVYNTSTGTVSDPYDKKVGKSSIGFTSSGNPPFYFSNLPTYSSSEDAQTAISNQSNTRVDWVTPELQDTFDNKGNLELLPSFDSSANYSMASQQALQELLSNLANNSLAPTQQLDLVNKFIEGLKTSETPEPSPNPDPNPEPSPNPEPNPNPDPEPGENEDNGKFTADLKTLFPFCIPFDLVDCFKLFNAEPETPRIEVPMHFGIIDVDYTWVIDLKDFDSVAVICRSMFLILFLIGLALATSKVIKW